MTSVISTLARNEDPRRDIKDARWRVAELLLDAGSNVVVWNRTSNRADALRARATVAASAELGARAS
jgi:hypothetical protein